MNIKNLTNVEILYNCDLKNKMLIKVPNTKFHLICTLIQRTGLWNLHIIELESTRRKLLAKQVNTEKMEKLINYIIENPIKTY